MRVKEMKPERKVKRVGGQSGYYHENVSVNDYQDLVKWKNRAEQVFKLRGTSLEAEEAWAKEYIINVADSVRAEQQFKTQAPPSHHEPHLTVKVPSDVTHESHTGDRTQGVFSKEELAAIAKSRGIKEDLIGALAGIGEELLHKEVDKIGHKEGHVVTHKPEHKSEEHKPEAKPKA